MFVIVYDVIHMNPATTHIYNNTKAALAFPKSVYLTRMQLLALFEFMFADTLLISRVLLRTAELGWTQSVYVLTRVHSWPAQLHGCPSNTQQLDRTLTDSTLSGRRDLYRSVPML